MVSLKIDWKKIAKESSDLLEERRQASIVKDGQESAALKVALEVSIPFVYFLNSMAKIVASDRVKLHVKSNKKEDHLEVLLAIANVHRGASALNLLGTSPELNGLQIQCFEDEYRVFSVDPLVDEKLLHTGSIETTQEFVIHQIMNFRPHLMMQIAQIKNSQPS